MVYMHVPYLKKLTLRFLSLTLYQRISIIISIIGFSSTVFGMFVFFTSSRKSQTQAIESQVIGSTLNISTTQNLDESNKSASDPATSSANFQAQETQLAVSIAGAVAKPGIYVLTQNSRIADVLTEAGGYSKSVNRSWVDKYLNLAEKISDETHIYIPDLSDSDICTNQGAGGVLGSSAGSSDQFTENNGVKTAQTTKVNVNTATAVELQTLKNIGEVRAQQIIENRPYKDNNEFMTKSGVSSSIITQLQEHIVFK